MVLSLPAGVVAANFWQPTARSGNKRGQIGAINTGASRFLATWHATCLGKGNRPFTRSVVRDEKCQPARISGARDQYADG